jgi:hypothetical protein
MTLGKLLFCAAMSAALTCGACESPGGSVSVQQSASTPVVAGSTYAWAALSEQESQTGDPRIDNDSLRERIKSAINLNLSAKGYREVSNPKTAALIVSYYVGLQPGTDYRVNGFGGPAGTACGWRGCIYGYGWGMYGPPKDTDISAVTYTDGTLILDLRDSASGKLAWRSTSQKRVDQSDGAQDKLNAMVADMTKSLPGLAPAA